MRGRLALDGRIGREDDLAHFAGLQPRLEKVEAELCGTDAIERRQVPGQHEVAAAVAGRLFDREHVRRRLDHAQERRVAARIAADPADLGVAEHAAARAMADAVRGGRERVGERERAVAVSLEQVERGTLRRLRAHAGQRAEGLDQPREQRRVNH